MGLAQKGVAYIEPEEYLAMESVAKEKHEYMDGVVFAWQGYTVRGMAGASAAHNRVVKNLTLALIRRFEGTSCEVFTGDLRVRPNLDKHSYFYPDVFVRCGKRLEGDAMEATDARLVIEVLSPTTEGFDRNDKFGRYKEMASLESYVLIDPSLRSVEVFERTKGWQQPPRGVRVERGSSVDLGVLELVLDEREIFADI